MTKDFTNLTNRDKYFEQLKIELKELIDPLTGKLRSDLANYISCPNCSNKQYDVVFLKNGFQFVQCNNCDLIYVNPQVRKEVLKIFYTYKSQANDMWIDVLLTDMQQEFNKKYYNEVLDMINMSINKGKLLDVGCSIGDFLACAKQRGFECEGIELNSKAVKYARTRGIDVKQKTLEDLDVKESMYDIITLLGVLEHLPNPKDILISINSILKPGGFIFVAVPNVYSFVTAIIKEKAKTFDGRNHLICFSVKTLQNILQSTGFSVLNYDTTIYGFDQIERYLKFGNNKIFLNDNLVAYFKDSNKKKQLKNFIINNDLGYRLRMFAQKI